MMKRLLISSLFILCFCINGKAQITIDHTHMPKAGDTLRYSIATLDTAILQNYQNNGANQTWGFDSLKAERQNIRKFYKSSNTPYSINNKIAEKIADTISQQGLTLTDIYEFYTVDSDAYSKDQRGATAQIGFSFQIKPTYSDKDEVYQFPLKYNDIDSSTFNFFFTNPFPPVYYGSSGYRINNVDGWGTINTPFGSFNCIRVVTDIVSYDSISYSNNFSGTDSHLREYKWLTPQLAIPALKITGNVVAGNFIPTAIEYRDSVRNVPSIFVPMAEFSVSSKTLMLGDAAKFSNNSISINTPTYNWSITPNTYNYINGTNAQSEEPEVVFTDSGSYDVQLIASSSHGKDTLLREKYIRVDLVTTSLAKQQQTEGEIKIFPNPIKSGQTINLEGTKGFKTVMVYNLEGSLVYQKELSQLQNSKLVLPNLAARHYFMQLIGNKNPQTIQLIIVD